MKFLFYLQIIGMCPLYVPYKMWEMANMKWNVTPFILLCVELKWMEIESILTVCCKYCSSKGFPPTHMSIWQYGWYDLLRISSWSWWPSWTEFTSRRISSVKASSTRSSVTATTDTSPTILTTHTITNSVTTAGVKTRPSDRRQALTSPQTKTVI